MEATNVLVKERTIRSIVYDDYSIDEFISLFKKVKPKEIFNTEYSKTIPAYVIVSDISDTSQGVTLYHNSWADKTPAFIAWKILYKKLKSEGLQYCRI